MEFRRWCPAVVCGLLIVLLGACGSSPEFVVAGQDSGGNPVEYCYLDEKTLEVHYLGNVYRLVPRSQIPAPFAYIFDKNGNCELLFGDFNIEIINPSLFSSGNAYAGTNG